MPNLPPDLDNLLADIAQVKLDLGDLGVVLRGTVTERYMPCGRKGCKCQAVPATLHGPYFQWTTKVDGKTKTVRLRPEEARFYREWIANGRKLDQVIKAWEQTGIAAAEIIRGK